MDYKIPLLLTPQSEGEYTVTSPLLPELVREGDSMSEALDMRLLRLLSYIRIWDSDCPTLHHAQRKCKRESVVGSTKRRVLMNEWPLARSISKDYEPVVV